MSYKLNKKLVNLVPYDPISGSYKIRLDANESCFNLSDSLKKKITDDIAEYSNSSGFYLQISEDYLCLVREVIHYIAPPETSGEYTLSGCGIDHEHLFFSERISLCPISTQRNASDNSI